MRPTAPLIVPPQHPLAAQPCCLTCGKRDGRTAVGGIRCHDCLEAAAQPTDPPPRIDWPRAAA